MLADKIVGTTNKDSRNTQQVSDMKAEEIFSG